MHTKGFLLLSGNKDSIKYILWEHKYEGSTCPLFFVNFPAAVCAWSWLAHSRLTGEVTWPQDASNYLVVHTLEHIQIHSCVVSKLSLINTQLHHGGFWSISSLLFVVSFPTLCLALLSTQTGDVITSRLTKQAEVLEVYIYYLICTRAQTTTRHCRPVCYFVSSVLLNICCTNRLASKHKVCH